MDINCPVCKQKNINNFRIVSSIYSDRFYRLGTCPDCGHIFLLDPPDKDNLERVYKEIYNYQAHLAIEKEKRWRFRRLKQVLGKLVPLDTEILDIGCGYGDNLKVLKACGYLDLSGIEVNCLAVDSCRDDGINVFKGEFNQWLISGGSKAKNKPACVILSHVLEHVGDLDDFFKGINIFLGRQGRLILLMPNTASTTVRLFGRYWGWWQPPVHLHHFSKASVAELLKAKGFKVDRLFTRGADSLFLLSTILSIFRISPSRRIVSALERIIIRINSAIFRYWLFAGNEELIVFASKI
ncbi:MAG: class I SAM-dependent methyltransferase [Candidatus Omnitrophota bacterium]|nr:class I SAM-dependent methyltransferase [Candidatus Omnitrophota bacterium]MBU1929405.1 class I SAM-dependent methyltransferase [Candidatus Omnitrophota bacterium]MBU2034280.1 class I SAM-dependent methyltransferase [Candidatus Omnitrophota bacterium]MBU2222290.1 class I SAM-dependent methyltransferase [Candidatus Omnitrophota bacterium]MBU2257598.1 class I SAM-dependent methyltransferase [Candidatus Omnitrophota bacterium]